MFSFHAGTGRRWWALRIIELPSKVKSVRQLEFVTDSFDTGATSVRGVLHDVLMRGWFTRLSVALQCHGVLCQDGIMRFIDVDSCKLLFDVGALHDRVSSATVSPTPNGRHIVTVMASGDLCICDVRALTSDINNASV